MSGKLLQCVLGRLPILKPVKSPTWSSQQQFRCNFSTIRTTDLLKNLGPTSIELQSSSLPNSFNVAQHSHVCGGRKLHTSSQLRSLPIFPAAAFTPPRTLLATPLTGLPVTQTRGKSKKGKIKVPFKYEPLKYLRKHGWEARMSTIGGRAVLMRRILAGRKWLTH